MAGGRSTGSDIGLLFLRLALGGIFIAHGVTKLTGGHTVAGFADFLAQQGVPFPYPAAVATIASEIGGGLVIVLGLGIIARLGAFALAVVMLVGIFMVHLPEKQFFLEVDPAKGPHWGIEYNIALLAMAICILFTGPGKFGLMSGGGRGGDHG